MRRAGLLIALGALLSACGNERESRAPKPADADETRALEAAAEMLDERRPEPADEQPSVANTDSNE